MFKESNPIFSIYARLNEFCISITTKKDTMTQMSIKMYLGISWIIVVLLGQLGDTVFRGKCQSEGYFQTLIGQSRLMNYVIFTRDVHSLHDCVLECLSVEHCSSCNFQVSGIPLHKCELNAKARSTARPGCLVRDDEFKYFEINNCKEETEPWCEKLGCQNGGTCDENCEALSFPHKICKCTPSFTGSFCEKRKVGNFLLNYNATTVNDSISVSVTGNDFHYLAMCFWVKPSTKDGVVFSYATQTNTREIALLFNESNVVLHLGGQVIPFNLKLPLHEWSHICFILYSKIMLDVYYNGMHHITFDIAELVNNSVQHQNTTQLPREIIVKGSGILIPAFEQISPGVINRNSSSKLTVTRLYMLVQSGLLDFEIFRIFNEPYFSVMPKEFRVDWREFYQAKTSVLVAPSNEPDLGNFDLQFRDNASVTMENLHIPSLDRFSLSMWIRVNTSLGEDATIFELLDADSKTVLKLKRIGLKKDVEFFFNSHNSSVKLSYAAVITDHHWFHLLFQWTKKKERIHLYKHGSVLSYKINPGLNVILPELNKASIRIGDCAFVGSITSLNLWSVAFSLNMITSLAINPGNAAGDIFSWKSLREQSFLGVVSSPSDCLKRTGQFDIIFPERNQNIVRYISLPSSLTSPFNSITVAFWIKIPSLVDEFTLISYAVPSQAREFNVHFGITGIWIHLHGNQRFVPLTRAKLVDKKWHHFIISYASRNGHMYCYHNGERIVKDKGERKSLTAKDGVLVIGAWQSHYNYVHESKFQFTGEISQLQIYRRTFNQGPIRTFSHRCSNIPGNFFQWTNMPSGINGQIHMRHQSECLKANNGEDLM